MSERDWTDERYGEDAPEAYSAFQANAWANGWNAAVEAYFNSEDRPTQPQEA